MAYVVKEIFYTLQGEGANTGRPAVFCRFTGCNLWSGREADRAEAVCRFCDTDFVGTGGPGGGKFATAEQLADVAEAFGPDQQAGDQRGRLRLGNRPQRRRDVGRLGITPEQAKPEGHP